MKAPTKYIDAQQKEALIVMITILFIEEHGLLRQEDLEDAKKSLQALFLRASGQATLLIKLIEVLRATRNVHQTFASIFIILTGIGKGVTAVDGKITLLRESLDQHKVTAEEYRDFIDLFLSFSQNFHRRLSAFAREIEAYVELKENEAKLAHIYRIARDARNQLRDRLKGDLGSKPRGKTESRIKDEVVSSFNYGESRESLELAIAESHSKEGEVLAQLEEIKAMCQMAMNPAMRERPPCPPRQADDTDQTGARGYICAPHRRPGETSGARAPERAGGRIVSAVSKLLRHVCARLEPPAGRHSAHGKKHRGVFRGQGRGQGHPRQAR